MPLITIEEAECPSCDVVFPLDGFNTEDVESNETECPECGATLCPEPGTFDPANNTVKLMEVEDEDDTEESDEEDGEEEDDEDDEN